MPKPVVLVFLIYGCLPLYSQVNLDSLRPVRNNPKLVIGPDQELSLTNSDWDRLYQTGSAHQVKGDYVQALDYYQQCLALHETGQHPARDAIALTSIGSLYGLQGDYDQGLIFLNQGLKLREEIGDSAAVAHSLKYIARNYRKQSKFPQALKILRRIQTMPDGSVEKEEIAAVSIILSDVYRIQGDYAQALDFVNRGLSMQRELGEKEAICKTLGMLGSICSISGDYPQAIAAHTESLELAEELGLQQEIATALFGIGHISRRQQDYPKAIENLQRSLVIREELGLKRATTFTLAELGYVYLEQGQHSLAMTWCEKGLALAEKIAMVESQHYACECLYEAAKALGKNDLALNYLERRIMLNDSTQKEDTKTQLRQMEFRQERLADSLAFVQQQADTELAYEKQLSRRNLLIFGGLALGILGFVFFRYRQQLRNREQELELRRERELKEQLEEINHLKSRFFANISHELRTPLTLILGPLSYILDQPEEWDNESVREQLMVMQRNGKSLMQLIEEILDLSKLEAGKLELVEEPTPVRQFFEYIFAVFEPQFQSQELTCELRVDLEQEDLYLLLDRKKLEKVLNNFLSNAIKFTPKGGIITLQVMETPSLLKIKVSDTGQGVHPRDLPHIFERFYQAKQATQKLYGGTGIGLALVNEYADLMGGRAYAESQLGAGSQFYFELSKKITAPASLLTHDVTAEWKEELVFSIGTDFTILVVEDNRDMREFVCQLLAKHYQVLSAQNGAEGLAQLQEHGTDIHLVVSDVMMPEIDGLSLLKKIKSHPEWAAIPVIMLTALAAERDKLTALTTGVDDYLTKPFSVSELLTRVQNLLFNYHQRLEWQKLAQSMGEGDAHRHGDEVPDSDQQWIRERESLITASLPTGILNVDQLADASFLSKRQLTRKIKAITGLTPGRYIKEVQLQLARQELENGTSISISEVAFNHGFEYPATFSTLFRKRFGKSPSDYLKSEQKHSLGNQR